eukprot:219187_1
MFWGNTKYSKWFPTQFNLLVNCISNVLKNDARASHLIDPKCIALKLSNTTNDSLLRTYIISLFLCFIMFAFCQFNLNQIPQQYLHILHKYNIVMLVLHLVYVHILLHLPRVYGDGVHLETHHNENDGFK